MVEIELRYKFVLIAIFSLSIMLISGCSHREMNENNISELKRTCAILYDDSICVLNEKGKIIKKLGKKFKGCNPTGVFIDGKMIINSEMSFIGQIDCNGDEVELSLGGTNKKIMSAFTLSKDLYLVYNQKGEGYLCGKQGNIILRTNNSIEIPLNINNRLYKITSDENGLDGYIDGKGELKIKYVYSEGREFWEGFAAVKKPGGKYYFINENGIKLINKSFDKIICDFRDGIAIVKKNKQTFFINKDGKLSLITSTGFKFVNGFSEGLAKIKKQGKIGYCNKKGEIVIQPQYQETYPYDKGLDHFISEIYKGDFSEGLAAVGNNKKKVGYINTKGEWVIEPQYEYGSDFNNGYATAVINKNGKKLAGVINKAGEWVVQPEYKNIGVFNK